MAIVEFEETIHSDGLRELVVRPSQTSFLLAIETLLLSMAALRAASAADLVDMKWMDAFQIWTEPNLFAQFGNGSRSDYSAAGWSSFGFNFNPFDAWLLFITAAVFIATKIGQVRSESVLVYRGLGVQLRTRYWTGACTTRFIPAQRISTIIINEGITMFQVKFYLAIIVQNEPKMTVAFPKTLPRLHILERVYVHLRETLKG